MGDARLQAWRLLRYNPSMLARPYTVVMDITDRCNLKCIMCYFSAVDRIRFPPETRAGPVRGSMDIETFQSVADDLFPHAESVALGCAAEPMLHSRFVDVLEIASRHQVPHLWFPTNLLALTERKAHAICDYRVTTVAASVDGFDAPTFEAIRARGSFERFCERLRMFNQIRNQVGERPRLRLIFTWMRANFDELTRLPDFAVRHGAEELDVRFVSPTVGVDNAPQMLDAIDNERITERLEQTAERASELGLKIIAWPEVRGRRLPQMAGRAAFMRHKLRQLSAGCSYPDHTFVIRPNGAVMPCMWWSGEPLGFYPEHRVDALRQSATLTNIKNGLKQDQPIGSCRDCMERRRGLYRPEALR